MPTTTIPFSGFYNSVHASAVDDSVESIFQNSVLLQRAADAADWGYVRSMYSGAYAAALAREFKIPMAFEGMKSPREYNFGTDIVYCTIAQDEVDWLFDTCDKAILAKISRETFTSYDGFASFYDPDFKAWGSTIAWDHNQIGVLIRAHIEEQNPDFDSWSEFDIMENARCNGALDNWIFESNPKELNRLAGIDGYLKTRTERA